MSSTDEDKRTDEEKRKDEYYWSQVKALLKDPNDIRAKENVAEMLLEKVLKTQRVIDKYQYDIRTGFRRGSGNVNLWVNPDQRGFAPGSEGERQFHAIEKFLKSFDLELSPGQGTQANYMEVNIRNLFGYNDAGVLVGINSKIDTFIKENNKLLTDHKAQQKDTLTHAKDAMADTVNQANEILNKMGVRYDTGGDHLNVKVESDRPGVVRILKTVYDQLFDEDKVFKNCDYKKVAGGVEIKLSELQNKQAEIQKNAHEARRAQRTAPPPPRSGS